MPARTSQILPPDTLGWPDSSPHCSQRAYRMFVNAWDELPRAKASSGSCHMPHATHAPTGILPLRPRCLDDPKTQAIKCKIIEFLIDSTEATELNEMKRNAS